MKKLMYALFLLGTMSCHGQKFSSCDIRILDEQLAEIRKQDQEIRKELMPVLGKYQDDGSGKLKLMTLALKMENRDQKNLEFVSEMLEKCGWSHDLSNESHHTVFLVLQHSPDSAMRKYFPLVQQKVTLGYLLPDDEATMYDRLQMRAGLAQKYGTQTFADPQNRNLVWPVENPDSLEVWRSQVGLPTMETYFQIAKDSTGVDIYWEKDLTLEEAINLK